MNAIQEARAALVAVLDELSGLRVYDRLGEDVDPPAVLVSLPRLEFNGRVPGEPTNATFTIPVFGRRDGTSDVSDELASWLPIVAERLDGLNGQVSVIAAEPGTWPAGGVELPAYLIQVEVALPWQ